MVTKEQLLTSLRNANALAEQGNQEALRDAQELELLLNTGQYLDAAQEAAPQENLPQGGSIADAFGQGVSFGFSDEIAGGVGAGINSIANLFGAGSGESFGDAYRGIRDAARYNQKAYADRNPGKALAAEVVGGLLTGGTGAARVGAIKGAQKLGKVAGVGAAEGGVYGLGASEADTAKGLLKDTAQGAALGGVTGAAMPAVNRAVGGLLTGANKMLGGGANKLRKEYINLLEKAGIPLTAGQVGDSRALHLYETTMGDIPLIGGPLATTLDTQKTKLQQKIMSMSGFTKKDAKSGLIDDKGIENAYDRFAGRYLKALGDAKINISEKFVDRVIDIQKDYTEGLSAGSGSIKRINHIINNLFDKASKKNLTGQEYQDLRNHLGKLERRAGSNQEISSLYRDIKRALDDEFVEAAGDKIGNKKLSLDKEWAHLKHIDKLNSRSAGGPGGAVSGIIPIGQLEREVSKGAGSKEFKQLLKAAAAVIPDRAPNSGTVSRAAAAGSAFTGGVINPSLLIDPMTYAGLGASRLINTALANPRAVQKGANAVGGALETGGLLAAPVLVGQDQHLPELPGTLANQMKGLL